MSEEQKAKEKAWVVYVRERLSNPDTAWVNYKRTLDKIKYHITMSGHYEREP